ncbi:MFS transporter [Mangrovimicrobium sediminis]|uniref:MFS transporter n=1 Tax=Mangrovimicrobium sediminis TaxID=2562682 RepID=A0A4Z0LZJ0_9GAMM|nr:MFS transporter [Haliea sp. SAOS-164]TGD72577.1 MFS transporter [Haliea sp. SAOS-164]
MSTQPPEGEATQPGTFAPLGETTFRNMWISNTISNAGGLIQAVASAWVMASIASADFVAMVQTATFLPMALFALPAGALADIYDRRKVQIVFFSLALVSAALMTLASSADLLTPWVLLGFCFMVGSGNALSAPARGASVGEQVPKELLAPAVALNNISYNLARSVGPAVGGVIVAALGATVAFFINAISYVPMLFSLYRWNRVAEVSRLPPEGLFRSIHAGVRFVANMRPVRRAIMRVFVISFLGAALQALLPLVAKDMIGGDASVFGLMLGAYGVGAVSGIFVLQRLRASIGNENIVRMTCVVGAAALVILAHSTSLVLDLVVLLVAGMMWMVVVTTISITVQLFVPRWVMGRAIATCSAATTLGISLGALMWGHFAEIYGLPLTFQASALTLLASLALTRVLRVADRTASTESDERVLDDPEVKLGITGRSGPISIELQYRIPAEKARDFYNLMREMQQVRSRTGAYDWSLSRNLADPELWSETYRLPTWLDYLRHRNRRTVDDMTLLMRAREMHVGIEPVRVQRWLDRPSGSVRWREDAPDRGDDGLKLQD